MPGKRQRITTPSLVTLSLAVVVLAASGAPAPKAAAGAPAPSAGGPADQLKESRQAWEKLKAEHKGNYSYDVRFQSWVGFGYTTTVVVRDNKVAERRYRTFDRRERVQVEMTRPGEKPKPRKPKKKNGWDETGKEIGSHKQGAPARTLDEIYDEAEKLVANPPAGGHFRFYLRFHKDGLLQFCFYVDKRIADDAPRHGVQVSAVRLGK